MESCTFRICLIAFCNLTALKDIRCSINKVFTTLRPLSFCPSKSRPSDAPALGDLASQNRLCAAGRGSRSGSVLLWTGKSSEHYAESSTIFFRSAPDSFTASRFSESFRLFGNRLSAAPRGFFPHIRCPSLWRRSPACEHTESDAARRERIAYILSGAEKPSVWMQSFSIFQLRMRVARRLFFFSSSGSARIFTSW